MMRNLIDIIVRVVNELTQLDNAVKLAILEEAFLHPLFQPRKCVSLYNLAHVMFGPKTMLSNSQSILYEKIKALSAENGLLAEFECGLL